MSPNDGPVVHPTYPAIRFCVHYGNLVVLVLAVAVAVATALLLPAGDRGSWIHLVAALPGAAVWCCGRLVVEIVMVIDETLLPK